MFVLKSMVSATIMVFIIFILAVVDVRVFPGQLITGNGTTTHQLISLKSVIVFENGSIDSVTLLISSIVILIISVVCSSLAVNLFFKNFLSKL